MIMVSEMTGDYFLLVPLMLSCAVAYIISGKWSIYEKQVANRAMSPAHRGEFSVDILEEVEVGKVAPKKVVTVLLNDTIQHVSNLIASTGHLAFPVIDDDKLVGIISYSDIVKIPHVKAKSILVKNVMQDRITTCNPNESLAKALRRMDETGYGHLPVVDTHEPSKLIGILSKRDMIRGHEAYKRGIIFEHIDVLDRVKVEEVMRRDYIAIDSDMPALNLTDLILDKILSAYPVVDHGMLIGIVNATNILKAIIEGRNVIMQDIVDTRLIVVHPEDSTHQAVEKMYNHNLGMLPVVDKEKPTKLLGIFTLEDVLRAYELKR
jgi:CIC family chloride channel protein